MLLETTWIVVLVVFSGKKLLRSPILVGYHYPLKKNEILDIFYDGLTDASRDHLDSCVGSVFRERTPDEAEILLNNMLTNGNSWAPPEPPPEPAPELITEPIPNPTPKKRGVLFPSPEDMQEAKKSMKKVLKLKMLRIYLLLNKYMVLIYLLLKNHIVLITRHR